MSETPSRRRRPRRWPFSALAALSVLDGLYCLSGFAMAGSFTVSNPEAREHWQRVALAYLGGAAACLALLLGSVVALWRRTRAVHAENVPDVRAI